MWSKRSFFVGIFSTAVLTGCGAASEVEAPPIAEAAMAPGGEAQVAVSKQAGEGGKERTPLPVPVDAAAASVEMALPVGPALDARAAAATEGLSADAPKVATIEPLASWYSGTVAPGGQQHWYWHNSGTGVYKVGLSPAGASTTSTCQFKVVRFWDSQEPSGGERRFHFILQNIGSIACGTSILLTSQAAVSTWSTGGVNPGATQGWTWNNANPLTSAHFVNVAPSGSTSTSACEFEVTRSWYSQQPGGERKFHFYVKNVGSIACVGTILLARNTNANSSWSIGTLSPGASASWFWNNANPLNRVYVPGVSPLGAAGSSSCQLELLPSSYQQRINTDGTSEREYGIGVKNVGSLTCSGTLLLNYLDS